MKRSFIGLFCFVLSVTVGEGLCLLPSAHAQIGSPTYQRVKAGTAPEEVRQAAEPTKKHKANTDPDAAYAGSRALTIGEDQELTFPADLKECRVFDSKSLEKAILQATYYGECEWIVLRSGSDWSPGAPMWLQFDKSLVIGDKGPQARGHPVVITNNTGRAIIFRAPKNGGCAVIINKPDVAILGFTFEGAICR
jgi:hypothetical protein